MSLVASTSSGSRDAQEWSVVLRAPDGRLVLYNSAQRNFSLASVSADVPVFQQDPLIEEEPEDQQQGVSLQVVPRRSARRSSELSLPAPAVSSSPSTAAAAAAAAATSPSASHAAAGGDRVCPLCGSDLLETGGRRRARGHSPRSATDTRNSRNSSGSAGNDEVESTQFMFRNHRQRHRAHAKPSLPPTENSYFALLSDSRMGTPTQSGRDGPEPQPDDPRLNEATMNTGYYDTFFRTIEKLGQGSNGSVYLVQHVLNGEPLGLYACKKVAVGNSTPALLSILREVHLLETLQNPHVISYHHAWIELVPATAFAPAVPTLFILMSYANGGSLEDFVRSRKPESSDPAEEGLSKAERIRYMRMKRMGAVHLFRVDEILSIFQDVTEGLAFLHSRNILHLDLKAANVLLHWEEDALLPTAKLCDFGSSDASFAAWSRARTGISGTLEYSAPESWNRDPKTGKLLPATRARDVWALGLILHLLCYFSLPWKNDRDIPQLEQEIKSYSGFLASEALTSENCLRHDLPMDLLTLMADMVHRDPLHRPKCDAILERIEHIRDRLVEQGQLPVQPGGASLVRQTSPSSFAPVPATTTSDLFHASSFQPQYGVSAARPSLQLDRRTSPPSAVSRPWLRSLLHAQIHVQHNGSWTIRIGRVQLVVPRRTRHQMVITLMGVSRLVLLEWHCSGGGQGHGQTKLSWTCAMLVLAVLEVVLNDYRLSISTLLASAAVALASTQARGICRAQPLSNQL